MPERKIKRALIAVYDKTGIAEFARALVEEFGIEIISTGGTARHLQDAGIPVTLVEQITGFPEMLDGRVKTLHPKIHAAILADRDNPDHMRQLAELGIEPIDMVVVNLYPFEKTVADPNCTFEQAIEMIDIGGPCLLRAAAKNHRHVLVLSHPDMYNIKSKTWYLPNFRLDMAKHAIWTTSGYDASIAAFLSGSTPDKHFTGVKTVRLIAPHRLRYGENPHINGAAYEHAKFYEGDFLKAARRSDLSLVRSSPLGGGAEMSFNNHIDADAALGLCAELTRGRGSSSGGQATCVFIKHTNACGVGVADDLIEAYRRAYLGDPNAAMGGVLAVNFAVTADFAATVMETYDRMGTAAGAGGFFVEVWVAPSFADEAVAVIRGKSDAGPKKKWGENVRLLAVGDMSGPVDPDELDYKKIAGGMLVQTRDLVGLNEEQWKVVTKRAPSESEMSDLRLAWLVAKHTKSNAVSICKDAMLIGNGAGQMSRVMSCRIATWLAKENGHAEKLAGSAAASDAFFPFRDGPDILIDAGVTAIIQPGGSKRDAETIQACDERGVAMVFTGTRHFRH